MENPEDVMMELSVLEKNPEKTAISQTLEEYLTYVAKTGKALFAWNKIKPLFKAKLEIVIQEFHDSCPTDDLPKQPNVDVFKFDQMKERILEQLESYSGIPFTIQRLCELLLHPKRHYKRTDKFMRGLEKIMLVVSTIDPNPTGDTDSSLDTSQESNATEPLSLSQDEEQEDSLGQESPSKRQRMSFVSSEEPGPCDSADDADAAHIRAISVEDEDLPIMKALNKTNGIEEINTAEAEAEVREEEEEEKDRSGGEENMDIDTECTSSQAKLSLSHPEPSSVEMEAGVDGVESTAGTDKMDIETEVSDGVNDGVSESVNVSESVSEGVSDGVSEGVSDGVSDGVSTSETVVSEGGQEKEGDQPEESTGNLHSSSEEANTDRQPLPEPTESNSEAEPVDVSEDDEKGEEETESQAIQESVQSSEERTESDRDSVREDSGAADSSDEVNPAPAPAPASAPAPAPSPVQGSDISPGPGPAPDTPETNSPDQSLQ